MNEKVKNKLSLEEKFGDRVTSNGLWHYADTYFKAFDSLYKLEQDRSDYYPVTFYLAFHSIELSLKAILRSTGYSLDYLQKEIKHDLNKLIKILQNKKLIKLTEKEITVIQVTNYLYKNKQFEYILREYKSLPAIEDVHFTSLMILDKSREYLKIHQFK
jgi:HEPN domain-containing protein